MAIFNPGHGVGLRNVGSYQVPGHPFLTGGLIATGEEKVITFPFVTKNVTVAASGSTINLRAHFNSTSSAGNVVAGKHYWPLDGDTSAIEFNSKCTKIYISCVNASADGGFNVVADLTGIDARHMYELTGAGLTD
jgi:hypothetical protein